MLKQWLFVGLGMALLSMPSYAKIIELKPAVYLDANFTRNHALSYSNGVFSIGKISITPSMNISNTIKNLTAVSNSIIMIDGKYKWDFGFNLSGVSLSNIDSVMFDLKGMKRLDDISFTDGTVRIIFDDLIDKGSLEIVNDTRIILRDPSTLTIDPTIEMLNNGTNKGYVSASSTTEKTPSFATGEITQSNYASINASDTDRYDVFQSSGNSFRFKYNRFVFNLSSINTSAIQWMRYCLLGSWYNNVGLGDGGQITQYFNLTLNDWAYDTKTFLPFSLLPTGETANCTNFSGSQIADVVNSSSLFQIGTEIGASLDVIQTTTHELLNYINLTVSYTEPPSDTCTYSSGDWFININDNCTLSTPNTINGNVYVYGSNGFLNYQANQYAHAFYYNVSSAGRWFYNNYRWLY